MILRGWQLALDVDDVLAGQGLEPAQVRSGHGSLIDAAERALAVVDTLWNPVVAYETLVESDGKGWTARLSASGARHAPLVRDLAGAELAVAIICTIGDGVERVAAAMMEDDPLLGFALDGAGSAAVEALADGACRYCEALVPWAAERCSVRLTPGIGQWPLDVGQRLLFSTVDAAAIGVVLNEASQMTPKKSASMLLGVGRGFSGQAAACDLCNMNDTCGYRTLVNRTSGANKATLPAQSA